jgi:pyochelin biosynthesis protein PchG
MDGLMGKPKRPIRVLLCGTQYGQTYLPAIFECKELELTGILAKGSDRSIRLSEQCNVPLFDSTASLQKTDETFDLACVAINDTIATPLATSLLQLGVPVLVEHPVHTENIDNLLTVAASTGGICHINSHFSKLPPIAEFIALCHKLNEVSSPLFINVSCNSRTLFSTLDILLRCFGENGFGKIDSNTLTVLHNTNKPSCYTVASLQIQLQQLPCTMTYQRWRGKKDNSQDSPLGHQILITYPEGTLSLGGTFGPTLWAPLVAARAPTTTPIYSQCNDEVYIPPTVADIIHWRKYANQRAILDLHARASGRHNGADDGQTPEHLAALCKVWTVMNKQLGNYYQVECAPELPPQMWRAKTLLALN